MESNQHNYSYKIARKKVKAIKGVYIHLVIYIIINLTLFVMDAREDGLEGFSNFFTPVFWGIGLLAHWFTVRGADLIFSNEWEKRKIQELMEKEKRKKWQF